MAVKGPESGYCIITELELIIRALNPERSRTSSPSSCLLDLMRVESDEYSVLPRTKPRPALVGDYRNQTLQGVKGYFDVLVLDAVMFNSTLTSLENSYGQESRGFSTIADQVGALHVSKSRVKTSHVKRRSQVDHTSFFPTRSCIA